MSEFTPKKLNKTDINGGQKIKDDDFFYPQDANAIVEGVLKAQSEIEYLKTNPPSGNITVDTELNDTSTNPVQNKVVNEALEGKVNKPSTPSRNSALIFKSNGSSELLPLTIAPVNGWLPTYGGDSNGTSDGNGKIWTGTPTKPYHASTKKYVDDGIAKLIEEFRKTWYEDITIANMYSAGFVSSTKLPNPTKIRIEQLELGKEYSEEVGDFANYYGLATPQTFDITPDSNGNFSVIIHANVYEKWEYNEEYDEWLPSEDNTPTQENVPLTLNFKFSFEDVVGDGVNQSLIFCYSLNAELNDYCEVSLYI